MAPKVLQPPTLIGLPPTSELIEVPDCNYGITFAYWLQYVFMCTVHIPLYNIATMKKISKHHQVFFCLAMTKSTVKKKKKESIIIIKYEKFKWGLKVLVKLN